MTVLTEESDAGVIGRALRQPEAFAVLFDRHYRKICVYAARRLGIGMADDIAAETFLIAFDQRHGYDRTRADAVPWLYGIAANLISHHARAEVRHLRALARTGVMDVVEWDGDAVAGRLDAAAVGRRLAEALAALPATEREVLLLVAWAGLSCQDASTALDIPAGTARSRLHRARTQMRAALGMTDCTESRPAQAADGRSGEGQKGMPKGGTAMTNPTFDSEMDA
jgi:RNA polymerase sigma-70 factor (ECF subfamily)